MSVASTVQLRSLATRRMTGNLSAISAIRLVEIRTAETQSGRRWDAPHKLIYVTTIGRTALGINKTDGRHEERANRVRRCVVASLSDNGGQPSRISCQDLPKALMWPKFSNI